MRKMKDSGIEWIGQIPQEWKTIRLRSRFSFGKGLPITKADLAESGIGVVSYGQIHSKANIGTTIKPELIRYVDNKYLTTNESSLVSNGDFIFADTSEDISGCGNCVYVDVDYPMFAGYHTMILRPVNELSTKYYSYLFATDAWRSQIRAQASGVKLFSITQKMLRDALLVEPSEEEKDRIVRYLDDKCAAIDELIAAKEKTNALLKEQRQSIIYEAVTKGLNPDAPMKDSGIEWIGEIPEHWDMMRAKFFAEITNGSDPKTEGDIPVYGSGSESFRTCGEFKEGPVVLLGRKGATLHIPHYVEGKYWNVDTAFDVRTNEKICLLKFYYYASICFDYKLYISTTTLPSMTQYNYGNMFIPIPSTAEQAEILKHIEHKLSELDQVITSTEDNIQKLKEYRQSIIYEAVTGKIEI